MVEEVVLVRPLDVALPIHDLKQTAIAGWDLDLLFGLAAVEKTSVRQERCILAGAGCLRPHVDDLAVDVDQVRDGRGALAGVAEQRRVEHVTRLDLVRIQNPDAGLRVRGVRGDLRD